MPCMMHGLMRKRGIVVVGGMERFKSGHLDIVVAGVVIGLRSADANGCVDAGEHHFKLNVEGFGRGDDRGGRGIFAVQSFDRIDRKCVVWGASVSVRVDRGGCSTL